MNYTKKSFTVAGTESSAISAYRANFDKVFRIEPDAHYAEYAERLTPEQAAFVNRHSPGAPCE